jgi:hypothetical protein
MNNTDDLVKLEKDRRERIATACLAGLITNPESFNDYGRHASIWAKYANISVNLADALIDRLDRDSKP